VTSGVFAGIGGLFLFLIPFPLILNHDDRAALLAHSWSDPDFRGLVTQLAAWLLVGTAFLLLALFVRRAGPLGLFGCLIANCALLAVCVNGDKEVVLIFPLTLSLVCLLFESFKYLVLIRRKTA
jgi:hypothetical protein